jgi:hypothetical protein
LAALNGLNAVAGPKVEVVAASSTAEPVVVLGAALDEHADSMTANAPPKAPIRRK